MHCQRIEINLGALAALSLMAIVVLSSRRKGDVSAICALRRVMSNKELGPRKIRVNSLDPGMIETEGLRASGRYRGAFREQQEKEPCLAESLQGDTPLLKVSNGIKLGV
jgi:3-oxoacyl-[acyl-carrier protein] reductase